MGLLIFVSAQQLDSPVDLTAARIALMALRAGLHDRESTRPAAYVIYPSDAMMDELEAARRLSELAKPLDCEGSSNQGAVIVKCQAVSRPDLRALKQADAEETIQDFEMSLRRYARVGDSDPLVEIRGYKQALVLNFSAVKKFFTDYSLASYGIRLDAPDEDAKSRRLSAILILGRGELQINEASF